eukprot:4701158-Pyramimonas_sp.AAC.1
MSEFRPAKLRHLAVMPEFRPAKRRHGGAMFEFRAGGSDDVDDDEGMRRTVAATGEGARGSGRNETRGNACSVHIRGSNATGWLGTARAPECKHTFGRQPGARVRAHCHWQLMACRAWEHLPPPSLFAAVSGRGI